MRPEGPTDVATRLAGIFDRIVARAAENWPTRTSGIFQFNIAGAGRWCLTVKNGVPRLATSARAPDCVIECPAGEFIEIAEGRHNLVTAFLQGRVVCSGNIALALGFRRLLPVF